MRELHRVLHIERGSFCAVLGPRGSGKTALLRRLSHCLRPRRGTAPLGADVVLLDEPARPLDRAQQYVALRAIHELTRRGITVVAVLRDLDAAAYFADRIVLMRGGRIAAHGEPRIVLEPLLLGRLLGSA
jgi:ABC-type hemin transport system ATPase subunit